MLSLNVLQIKKNLKTIQIYPATLGNNLIPADIRGAIVAKTEATHYIIIYFTLKHKI